MINKTAIKGRPEYYITPTRDFTQYTKDCEEKYWNKETKFDWKQDVRENLSENLNNLNADEFIKVMLMVLPMMEENIGQKIDKIHKEKLPIEEDALKDIVECIQQNRPTIQQALIIQQPLKELQQSVSKLNDKLEIFQSELVDLKEQQRLGFFNNGTTVRLLKTTSEKEEQSIEVNQLSKSINQGKEELKKLKAEYKISARQEKIKIRKELDVIEPRVLLDLKETQSLIKQVLDSGRIPTDSNQLSLLKDLILKRQLRGLKDLANHSLVVEQSAIAPLTMGIIHYKRHREIQEAMTTFINDEAKHSATFRRFLVEKLEAKEFISGKLIDGANRYMWVSRFMPGMGLFMAVVVEAIGAAYLEFFGIEKYMPDKLFCSICKTISEQDEKRHLDLCVAMYNELFRKGTRWERTRNKIALKTMLKSVYGDKTEDHHLIQAFRAFGVESNTLYNHIVNRLSQQLARISMYIEPETLLEIIGQKNDTSN